MNYIEAIRERDSKIRRLEDVIEDLKAQLGVRDSIYDISRCDFIQHYLDQRHGCYLTATEAKVLDILIERPTLATKDMIFDRLYFSRTGDELPTYKIIDVLVCKLRKKLKALPNAPTEIIETSWGRGYRLSDPAKHWLQEFLNDPNT